jgi:hypothetical protein
VDLIISISDLKKLQKTNSSNFELVPFVDQSQTVNKYLDTIKKRFVPKHAFYEGFTNKKNGTIRSAIYFIKNRQTQRTVKIT